MNTAVIHFIFLIQKQKNGSGQILRDIFQKQEMVIQLVLLIGETLLYIKIFFIFIEIG